MQKIIHIDMDAFFVSAELLDRPDLTNQPVAVGGASDRRGVISTCNYIARQYGVRSAMSTAIAMQKCPQLVLLPTNIALYRDYSNQVRKIFTQFTDKVEPLSLDEAYLDVTKNKDFQGSATLIAEQIRQKIFAQTKLTASAGIAPVKFLAKIASDINKPNGQFTIRPQDVDAFIDKLDLAKIPGVGPVTYQKLKRLGLYTGFDVKQKDSEFFTQNFGKFGKTIWKRCHGIDERKVETVREAKSIGLERTFDKDIKTYNQLKNILLENIIPAFKQRVNNKAAKTDQPLYIKNIGIKLKFADFSQTTKAVAHQKIDETLLCEILQLALDRGQGKSVRLLGVFVGLGKPEKEIRQLSIEF